MKFSNFKLVLFLLAIFHASKGDVGNPRKMLLDLMGLQNEGLERCKGTHEALEDRGFTLVFKVVAPHFVEFTALRTGIAQHLLARVHFPISWNMREINKS